MKVPVKDFGWIATKDGSNKESILIGLPKWTGAAIVGAMSFAGIATGLAIWGIYMSGANAAFQTESKILDKLGLLDGDFAEDLKRAL